MTFGDKLKTYRTNKDMSQDELAKLLGTSKQVLSRYENNQRTPKITVAQEYAEKLGLPLSYLIDDNQTSLTQQVTDNEKPAPQTQNEPTPEEIQFLLEEMRAGRGSKEASILYYGGKPKPADEKMLELEKAIDRRNNLQSMAEKTAELILDGESPAMLVSYINDKWEQIPLTEDELKAIRILLQK